MPPHVEAFPPLEPFYERAALFNGAQIRINTAITEARAAGLCHWAARREAILAEIAAIGALPRGSFKKDLRDAFCGLLLDGGQYEAELYEAEFGGWA